MRPDDERARTDDADRRLRYAVAKFSEAAELLDHGGRALDGLLHSAFLRMVPVSEG